MNKDEKTYKQLITELNIVRQRVKELEALDVEHFKQDKALKEREAQMQAILRTAADAIIIIDEKGNVQTYNPAAEKIFGYSAQEVQGQNVKMLMPKPYKENHDEYIERYLKNGKPKVIGCGREVVALRKDGTIFPIELALSEIILGEKRLFTGIIRDITERKKAEAELETVLNEIKKGNEDLLAILNMLGLGILTIDQDGFVSFLNQIAQNLVGKNLENCIGKHWEKLIPLDQDSLAQIKEMIKIPARQRKRFPVNLNFHDGRNYWLEIDLQRDPRDPKRNMFILYDMSEVHDLRNKLEKKAKFHDLVGLSEPIQVVYQKIREASTVDWTVLIEGETGTGKELVARAIHYSSNRKAKPFVAINCAGLDDSLLNSQLFGHKRGAFTGAVEDHKGFFEFADGGTIFLDEIGDISTAMQTNLLRVLEEKEFTRVGDSKPIKLDIRILAATNKDIAKEIEKGMFRADLYYRIRVIRISLPSLRDRREDIPILVENFLEQCCESAKLIKKNMSTEAMNLMLKYHWPGNVRELKSTVELAVLQSKNSVIHPGDLPGEIKLPDIQYQIDKDKYPDEKQRILQALQKANGSRTIAARILGMSRATFYRHLQKYKIR
ncbi:MAG: hypothetical protein A2161_00445 [Candidatus Schekmanbacteria bacterium RBG_13_48_7]|uniref:Sensor protein FixL n=1 Tax=Candidatus Schekmanbacteria bacterium RBG_13_48_7 TaxID=1817878 RepID=A0A1F7RKW2_9BACT|nr:MAG: hypothetical protein A2161_00445 [Candidatus Schekmanbacteria bacterium RBG_13_48_7]